MQIVESVGDEMSVEDGKVVRVGRGEGGREAKAKETVCRIVQLIIYRLD